MADRNVVIIGSGPYGLGAAHHLRRAGVDVAVYGQVMSFWQRYMPDGMFLRSSAIDGCDIGEQTGPLTLASFSRATGKPIPNPLPLAMFVEYGKWYQSSAVPDLDPRLVERVERRGDGYAIELADGESITARRVVVATGIDRFAAVPAVLEGLDPQLASHSTAEGPLTGFAGKDVAVIGGGQSAFESAALLHEQGARVELIVRAPAARFLRGKRLREFFGPLSWLVYPPEDVGPPGINLLTARPQILRKLPRDTQTAIGRRAIKPAGAEWLVSRLEGVPMTLGTIVVSAEEQAGRVRLRLSDGSERTVDHVVAGTGFKIDITKYAFLAESLLRGVANARRLSGPSERLRDLVAGPAFPGRARRVELRAADAIRLGDVVCVADDRPRDRRRLTLVAPPWTGLTTGTTGGKGVLSDMSSGLRSQFGYVVRASGVMARDPSAAAERIRGRLDRRRDADAFRATGLSTDELYPIDGEWQHHLHDALGVPWPCNCESDAARAALRRSWPCLHRRGFPRDMPAGATAGRRSHAPPGASASI